ncbi:carbohydrate porin, partial [Raoultella ornithinolytica]|nr:carbohydrate porin [Raoultella ornithinolytica]
MNMIKKLPLTMAVIAALCPFSSVMAQEFTQEQIDAIVAKAVDKALADRQAKMDAAARKVDLETNPQTTAASPDMAIPFGLKFSGYARYGAHFQTGDQKYI